VREPGVLQVARQAEQHGAAGVGADRGDHDRVGAQATAVVAGVGADEQHVDAAVLGGGVAPAGEDLPNSWAWLRDRAEACRAPKPTAAASTSDSAAMRSWRGPIERGRLIRQASRNSNAHPRPRTTTSPEAIHCVTGWV
jgi:hypothetical protein